MAVLAVLIVCWLELGVFGRLAQVSALTPNLLVVFLWAFTWFNSRRVAMRLAIWGGLVIDLAGFSYFGIWTLVGLLTVLVVGALRSRFLDASSILHALITLGVVSMLAGLVTAVAWSSLAWSNLLLGAVANVALGLGVYYLLAMRLRLFSRWSGRRVE